MADQEMQQQSEVAYVKMMKVAAAMACIRSKPDSMTAREYTQQLCDKFQSGQLQWQEKSEAQEREILHLKQELLFSSLFRSESVLEPDNKLDICDNSSAILTPPCSGTMISSDRTEKVVFKDAIDKHSSFLRCALNLQTAAVCPTSQFDEVTRTTVLYSMKAICDCIVQSDNKIPVKSILTCIDHIHKLIDSDKVKQFSPFSDNIVNIIEAAVNRLVTLDDNRKVTEREDYIKIAVNTLHPKILIQGITVMVNQIGQFSNHLRQVCKKCTSLDPQRFENIFYVIQILEDCLLKYRTIIIKTHQDFITFVIEKLDEALLHLTVKFPLYAHAIWKIHAVLSHMAVM